MASCPWVFLGPSSLTYPNFANLVLVDGDVGVVDSHGDQSHIGHSRVAPVLILGCDSEGSQALGTDPRTGSSCQQVAAGAHEVKVPAIEGVVVRVTPQPTCGIIVGHTHGLTALILAGLLRPASDIEAWVCGERRETLRFATSMAAPSIPLSLC